MKDITASPLHIEDVERFKRGHATVRITVPSRSKCFIGILKTISIDRENRDNFNLRLEDKITYVSMPGKDDPSDPGESLFARKVPVSLVEDDQAFVLGAPQRIAWPGLSDEFLVVLYKTRTGCDGWAVFTARENDLRTAQELVRTASGDGRSEAAA